MGILDRLKKRRPQRKRVFVFSIDGTPFSFMQGQLDAGRLPAFRQLISGGSFSRMNSVYPTVSSVAWSSYMTGQNPGRHGIFGFVDRDMKTMRPYIPTSRHMYSRTLWELLSDAGRRVVVMNVPLTYPPRQVNGILIGCFLSPSLEKATYPPDVAGRLKQWGYRIDTDPWLAVKSKDELIDDVFDAFEKRVKAMFHLLREEEWDFFHCHIMETDRLFHFLWEEMELEDPQYAPRFFEFIDRLDQTLGRLLEEVGETATVIVMSDHGFCRLEKEVHINHWLAGEGWLKFDTPTPKSIADLSSSTTVYSMDPGRIFINLQGREGAGSVPASQYEMWRERAIEQALALKDPDSGRPLFAAALRREDIYHGPLIPQAADLILVPQPGFDPKGSVTAPSLTVKGPALDGMHTYDDALLAVAGQAIRPGELWIGDVMPTILQILGLDPPPDLDGQSLLV